MRLTVVYRNDNGKRDKPVMVCPADRRAADTLPRVTTAIDDGASERVASRTYCSEHPGTRIVVQPGKRIVLWAVFPRDARFKGPQVLDWHKGTVTFALGGRTEA